ncbi:MAG: family 2 glycosyl transferase [Flavobacteriaceae bacterium]|nr:MAG: family 2 glycosyl transferase [Flavobacteriaceae bacterium]
MIKKLISYFISKYQEKYPKTIPIIIVSFNQLYYLEKLLEFLWNNGYYNIVILDNNSTYPPLLNFFKSIKQKVKIVNLGENLGHTAFWDNRKIFNKYRFGYYVITDPDIVPVQNCPDNFMEIFLNLLKKHRNVTKVGFSLQLDTIPETNKNREIVLKWESQFWESKIENHFLAGIDTTFALYRPLYKRNDLFCSGIRTSYPYQAIHGGWYINHMDLTDEQKFYMSLVTKSSSWRINEQGDLLNKAYIEELTKMNKI